MEAGVSPFEGAAVMLGLMIGAYLTQFYCLRYAVDIGTQVSTGEANGAPIPLRMRWTLIYHSALPTFSFLVVFNLFVAVGFITLAEGTSGSLEWLAKAAAIIAGSAGVAGVFFFGVYLHHLIALLRDESA